MPLIPRPKYRSKDWRLAMRTRERNEARTWAIRMRRERDKLYVSWEADRNSLKLTHGINIKLQRELDDVISQRDNLQQQRDYYQGSKDGLVRALQDISNVDGYCTNSGYIAAAKAKDALAKADEL